MKVFLICSKSFYDRVPEIKKILESSGHTITLPNSYDNPQAENEYKTLGNGEHAKWKASMFEHSLGVINNVDSVLVLNFTKNGVENYIGGATFIEMYDAFRLGKKIYLYNAVPEGILKDEICGFSPTLINGNLSMVS